MTNEELEVLRKEVEAYKAENTRLTRKKARERRKAREQVMRDLGLTKVRGCVSGKTYWE